MSRNSIVFSLFAFVEFFISAACGTKVRESGTPTASACMQMCSYTCMFSIYTLSDLGDLSNLIGSLSRTIQQYSPPSEWIMCELSVFPLFFRERSFKSRHKS